MRVFIVRPFGTKEGIDFDLIQKELIDPALKQLGMAGGTTGEFVAQGNIRTEMFEQLAIADVVIADISIHNANVFYELGVRHAIRDRQTILIRSHGAPVPFDLKTDRYLKYDHLNPGGDVQRLVEVLQATQDSQRVDSPIFQLLPDLPPAKTAELLVIPAEFRDEVALAQARQDRAYLQLLSADVRGLSWEQAAWRLIGRTQIQLKDYRGAKDTWESIRNHYDRADWEANSHLATIYQRMGKLVNSDVAVNRVLKALHLDDHKRAEAFSLKGRNAKTRWIAEWDSIATIPDRRRAAIQSPFLAASFDAYARGFAEDRRHFYSGLNGLALVSCWLQLAEKDPDLWREEFESEEEARYELKRLGDMQRELSAGVKLAIASRQMQLTRQGTTDVWANLSEAQLSLLTSKKPRVVAKAFRQALLQADLFSVDAELKQLRIYEALDLFSDNTKAARSALEQAREYLPSEREEQPPHVLLFTGHRIDAANRSKPRFPNRCAPKAGELIREHIVAVKNAEERRPIPRTIVGIAGGASGGDILFHEICQDMGISTEMLLACPKSDYIRASVATDEGNWIERFQTLVDRPNANVRSLNTDGDFGSLPREQRQPSWLRAKANYSIWERTNLWMLYSGLQRSQDDITLIALWNGQAGDGPGGTEDMVNRAKDRGANIIHIDSNQLL